jgi:dephospho-CoA kinase
MRVAVTGGIAEGKSTVLGYLAELGYETASSDLYARECFFDEGIQHQLANLLETQIPVSPDQLRPVLASSFQIRRAVNRAMHPLVVDRILASSAEFFEVPLLIETCLHPLFDEVWVVTCGLEEQLLRLAERYGEDQAMLLIDSQLRTLSKTPFCDVEVRTNTPQETVKRFVGRAARRVVSG